MEVIKDEPKNGAVGEGNARRCESGKKKVYYVTWFEKVTEYEREFSLF